MTEFTEPITALAGWLLLACGAWGVLLLAALACETRTGGRVRALTWVGCPPALRRALFLAIGATLVCEAPAAMAHGTDQAPGALTEPEAATSIAAPTRATGHLRGADATHEAARRVVVVRPGDSLWAIVSAASTSTGTTASLGRVARLVDQVHHTNRRAIGPDPDHIEPGQRLRVPRALSQQSPQEPSHHSKEQP